MTRYSSIRSFADFIPARRLAAAVLLIAAVAGCILSGTSRSEAAPITVTDMRDRTVTIPAPAKRIVLAEGRHILTLALLDKDPVSLVAAWGNDLRRFSPETFEALKARFPRTAVVPEVGGFGPNGGFSMEAVIAAKPDLVLFTMYGPVPQGIEKLDAAKVPYVFVDFFQKPLEKTVPSMRMLGKVLDRERQAEAFVAFYEQHMGEIAARIAKLDRPAVFFHLNPNGKDCCYTSGPGNMSDFIAAAGGYNIGADKVPGSIGKLGLEYVLSRDPDFYLAGGGSTVALEGLKIGPAVPKAVAEATMAKVLETPGLTSLRAVQQKRTGGIWLFFFDNPLFFVGVEDMAKMLHPSAFADVDPDRTLSELNARHLAFPMEGTFWITGRPGAR